MSTHAIGAGKVNVSVTMDVTDARRLGRQAFVDGMSRNEWARKVILDALTKSAKGAMFALVFGSVAYGLVSGMDMRRGTQLARKAGRRKWEEIA